MNARFKRPFNQAVKKARKPLQLAIKNAVETVCANPECGEAKIGDLAGLWVYKFKFQRQEYLMAYRLPAVGNVIHFYQVGPHENFYNELKRYLRTEVNP